jgi:transporter family protein
LISGDLPPWAFWALLSAVFAASTAILAKVGVDGVNSDLATFIRTGVVFIALAGIVAARGLFKDMSSIPSSAYIALTLSGLATGASWLCYFRALQLGDAARVAPVDKLSVILVALFGVTFLGEHLTLLNWLGIVLVFAGVLLLTWQ